MTGTLQDLLTEISRLDGEGRAADAESLARRLLDGRPDSPPALNSLAVLLAQRGALDEALPLARRATALAPNEPVFQGVLGRILYQRGDLEGAEASCRRVAALRPGPDSLRNLALVQTARGMEAAARLRSQGRDTEALAAYEQVITAAPDHVAAHREYTDLAWSLGHDIRELKSYAFARERIGDQPDLLLAEAETRLRLNQAAMARALLTRADDIQPGRGDITNALARAHDLLSCPDEARAAFQAAIAAQPDEISYQQDFAAFLLRAGAFADAHAALQPALARARFDQSSLALLASAQRGLGDAKAMDMTLVHEVQLPAPRGFADVASFSTALAEELMARHTHRTAPLDQTLRGGTQTVGRLFSAPTRAVGLLHETIARALEDHVAALPRDAAHPFLGRAGAGFDFAGSWSSCLAPGGFHTNHIHPGGWISSAYYVALPDDKGALQFGQSQFLLGEEDRPLKIVTPMVGKLVLFPSYLWHGTMPFQAGGPRLTVAFDAVPRT